VERRSRERKWTLTKANKYWKTLSDQCKCSLLPTPSTCTELRLAPRKANHRHLHCRVARIAERQERQSRAE
jgi:hypothetical protein